MAAPPHRLRLALPGGPQRAVEHDSRLHIHFDLGPSDESRALREAEVHVDARIPALVMGDWLTTLVLRMMGAANGPRPVDQAMNAMNRAGAVVVGAVQRPNGEEEIHFDQEADGRMRCQTCHEPVPLEDLPLHVQTHTHVQPHAVQPPAEPAVPDRPNPDEGYPFTGA